VEDWVVENLQNVFFSDWHGASFLYFAVEPGFLHDSKCHGDRAPAS